MRIPRKLDTLSGFGGIIIFKFWVKQREEKDNLENDYSVKILILQGFSQKNHDKNRLENDYLQIQEIGYTMCLQSSAVKIKK